MRMTSSKILERNPEKIVVFYDQLMRNTIAPMLAPYEKRDGIKPETKYILVPHRPAGCP